MREYITMMEGTYLLTNTKNIIVRCKDCRKNGTGECPWTIEFYSNNEKLLGKAGNKPDDFCSRGERR